METMHNSRRNFLKGAGTSLVAAGAFAGIGLSLRSAHAALHEAVTQTKETQAATSPEKALQMAQIQFAWRKLLFKSLLDLLGACVAVQRSQDKVLLVAKLEIPQGNRVLDGPVASATVRQRADR